MQSTIRVSRGGIGEAMTIDTAVGLPSPGPSSMSETHGPWRPPMHSRQNSRTMEADTRNTSHYVDNSPRRFSKIEPDTWRTSHESSRRNSRATEGLPALIPAPPSPPPRSSRRDTVEPLNFICPSPPRRSSTRADEDPLRPPHSRHKSEARHIRRHSRTISSAHSRGSSESHGLLQSPLNYQDYSTRERTFRYDHPVMEKRKVRVWAGVPQTLEIERREWWRRWIWDVVSILMAGPFFIVVGMVMASDGEVVTSGKFRSLDELTRVLSTIFPLAFSLILGRAFIKLATYKLERGTTLGLLERFLGSRTVFGTILTQFRLGTLSFLSLGLILLWLLSPFGSQAALRMLSTTLTTNESPLNITYVSTRQPTFSGFPLFRSTWFLGLTSLFSAALLAPVTIKTGPQDLWSNIKIPLLSSLANLPEDRDGWRTLPSTSFTPTYSSIFGTPISNIPLGNSSFSIESTYLELTCSNLTSSLVRTGNTFIPPALISTSGPFKSGMNISDTTSFALGYLGADMSSFLPTSTTTNSSQCLDCVVNSYSSSKQVPGLLLWQDFTGAKNVVSIFCVPNQSYVESLVTCNTTAGSRYCRVSRQRTSVITANPSALTLLSFQTVITGLSQLLPQVAAVREGVDILQNYLVAPNDNGFISSTPTPRWIANSTGAATKESRILDVELQDFSARLSQVLNGFLEGSAFNSSSFLTGEALIANEPATSPEILAAGMRNRRPSLTVPGVQTTLTLVFKCDWVWAAVLLLATTFLLAAAVFTIIIRRKTLARDYLPYVSSLIRESQFVNMPKGGVRMDGMSRSKEMKDLKVRLADVGDVGAGWEVGTGVAVRVGQLAVADWSGVKGEKGGIAKGNLYM